MPRYQLAMTEAGRDRTTITFDDSRSLAEMVIAVRSDGALTISGNWKSSCRDRTRRSGAANSPCFPLTSSASIPSKAKRKRPRRSRALLRSLDL